MAAHSRILAWKIPWTEAHEGVGCSVVFDSFATPWTVNH